MYKVEERTAVQAATPKGAMREEAPVNAASGGVGSDLSALLVVFVAEVLP